MQEKKEAGKMGDSRGGARREEGERGTRRGGRRELGRRLSAGEVLG